MNIFLKLIGLGKFGPVITAALAVKANPNPETEGALLDAAKNLGEAEDPALTPVFEAVGAVGHDAINLIAGRTTALEVQAAKDLVGVANVLVPTGKQVPQADLDSLENAIIKVISDEGLV